MTSSHPDGVTLNGYADGTLPPAAEADVSDHVASCAGCRALVEDLQRVRAAARALRPLTPPPAAWDRIERSLRPASTPGGAQARRWSWLAMAAALVVATFIGFALAGLRRQPADTGGDATTAQSVDTELRLAEAHYQKAIAGLEEIVKDGKGVLDPGTAATLDRNLAVIDQAVNESRAALRSQPASVPAQASLLESLKSKIALLQETVAIINEVRLAQRGA